MKTLNQKLLIIAGISGFFALIQLLAPFILKFAIKMMNKPDSNGSVTTSSDIIGGADGPTAIFISSSERQSLIDTCFLIANISVMIGSIVALFLHNKSKKES